MLRKTMGLAMPLKLQMEKKAVKKVCLQSTDTYLPFIGTGKFAHGDASLKPYNKFHQFSHRPSQKAIARSGFFLCVEGGLNNIFLSIKIYEYLQSERIHNMCSSCYLSRIRDNISSRQRDTLASFLRDVRAY